jgi:hypothetical protein
MAKHAVLLDGFRDRVSKGVIIGSSSRRPQAGAHVQPACRIRYSDILSFNIIKSRVLRT